MTWLHKIAASLEDRSVKYYELYNQRGCGDGLELDDWVHARGGTAELAEVGDSWSGLVFKLCPAVRHAVRLISASPLSSSCDRRRCTGISDTTTSSVGHTRASNKCPPCAVPSALPTTT